MMKKIQLKILIPVIVVILLLIGLAAFFLWPEGEEISEKIIPPDWIVWNVPEGKADPELEREIKKSVYELCQDEELRNQSIVETRKKLDWYLSIELLKVEGDWAIVSETARYKETNEYVPTEGTMLLAHKAEGYWEVIHTGDKKFAEWLPLVPDSLISVELKEYLKMRFIID